MAIAEKLQNIVNEKQAQIIMTNYGLPSGSKITASTKFIDYPKYIFNAFLEALRTPDTLFTNLPKKSGSGSVISLNDTANAPMRITLGASELSQDATPTPSSPQDIHTISGSNKVVVNGSQLFDYNDFKTKMATLTTTGTGNTFTISGTGKFEYTFNQDEQCTLSGTWSTTYLNGDAVVIYEDNTTGVILADYSGTSKTGTINLTTNSSKKIKTIRFWFYNSSNVTLTNFMINKGNQATTYEPYVSQEADIDLDTLEYCKIGNYEDKFIRTSGKNLLNITGSDSNSSITITAQPNGVYITGTSTSSRTFSFLGTKGVWSPAQYFQGQTLNDENSIKLSAGTYTLSYTKNGAGGSVLTYLGDYGARLDASTNLSTTPTFTITEDKYLFLGMYIANSTATNYLLENIQLEKNSSATSFEPYGNGTWYIKKNIGKVVLDGSETWNSNLTSRFYVSLSDKMSASNSGFCNRFVVTTSAPSNNEVYFAYNSTNIYFQYNDITSTADFKTWLGTHNTDVYYPLATPTYTKITGTLAEQLENVYKNMLSQAGQTNISQENDGLPFELDVSALESI